MGLVLDQCRRQPGSRLHRPADGPDIDDPVDGRQRVAAARQLRQGHRRLDVPEWTFPPQGSYLEQRDVWMSA